MKKLSKIVNNPWLNLFLNSAIFILAMIEGFNNPSTALLMFILIMYLSKDIASNIKEAFKPTQRGVKNAK